LFIEGKLGIDHMHELEEKKCQSDLISLMIFSIKANQFSLTIFSVRMI
jgi:hypothetical protein